MSEEVTGRLIDWEYDTINHVIWGHLVGDTRERFRDGAKIHTSNLSMSRAAAKTLKTGDLVKTRNSLYLLDERKNSDPLPKMDDFR